MADCIYCGEPAGFLRKSHPECRNLFEAGEEKITASICSYSQNSSDPEQLKSYVADICKTHFIKPEELHRLVIADLTKLIGEAFDDHLITEQEEQNFEKLRESLDISVDDLTQSGAYAKLAKAAILRDIEQGAIPQHAHIAGGTTLNFQKNESFIWAFDKVTSYAIEKHTEYVGGSSGASVRVTRGVYFRTGSYRGHSIKTENLIAEATGALIITNKNVYFYSASKNYRLSAKHIISVTPYSDGIKISIGGAVDRSHLFTVDDPSFAVNVISKLGQL